MRELFAQMSRVAQSDAPVLILGETGTGKELVARAIHDASARASGPFVIVDCAALASSIIEGELFGHARGAFTGAVGARAGSFEAANGGTIFLDEIGELPLELQPKLLRVLESRSVKRLGESEHRPIDVRLVAATHRDLRRMVNAGAFREDLYFRIAVLPLALPPLRARKGDIPLLFRHFLAGRRPVEPVSERELAEMPWLGNVRELRNFVERACAIGAQGRDAVQPRRRSRPPRRPRQPDASAVAFEQPFKEFRERWIDHGEREYLQRLLERHGAQRPRRGGGGRPGSNLRLPADPQARPLTAVSPHTFDLSASADALRAVVPAAHDRAAQAFQIRPDLALAAVRPGRGRSPPSRDCSCRSRTPRSEQPAMPLIGSLAGVDSSRRSASRSCARSVSQPFVADRVAVVPAAEAAVGTNCSAPFWPHVAIACGGAHGAQLGSRAAGGRVVLRDAPPPGRPSRSARSAGPRRPSRSTSNWQPRREQRAARRRAQSATRNFRDHAHQNTPFPCKYRPTASATIRDAHADVGDDQLRAHRIHVVAACRRTCSSSRAGARRRGRCRRSRRGWRSPASAMPPNT